MSKYHLDPAVRFWAKVNKTNACWLWVGGKARGGYGQFRLGGMVAAHRFSYELLVRPIPAGFTIDHLCRTPACVRPDHLEPVTLRENIRRGNSVTAINARKTHCPQGHAYDGANTHTPPSGGRWCRSCDRERKRIRRAATIQGEA